MVRGLAGERGVGHAEGQMLGSAAHQDDEWPGMSWNNGIRRRVSLFGRGLEREGHEPPPG